VKPEAQQTKAKTTKNKVFERLTPAIANVTCNDQNTYNPANPKT